MTLIDSAGASTSCTAASSGLAEALACRLLDSDFIYTVAAIKLSTCINMGVDTYRERRL